MSRLVKVIDGDTFRCDIDGWPKLFGYNIPVRVCGVNTPERNSPEPVLRELARKAKSETQSLLLNGKRIVLKNISRGKYFRLIADVEIDGLDLGEYLVSNGLAVRRFM